MRVQIAMPCAVLSSSVEYFWLLEGSSHGRTKELALPDGSMELVIDLREARIPLSDRHGRVAIFGGAVVCGPHTEYFVIDNTDGQAVIGAHLKPGGAAALLARTPASALCNACVSPDDLWGRDAADLRDELLYAATTAERFAILERFLLSRIALSRSPHRAVRLALDRLRRQPHHQSIAEAARLTGLSHKGLIDAFKRDVGMGPKRFCRLLRFQQILQAVRREQSIAWPDLAAAGGYCDQAHMIREFQAFSGLSPTVYQASGGRHAHHVSLP